MEFGELYGGNAVTDALVGGTFGVIAALGIFILLLIVLAFYIYFAVAWMTIARKLNYKYPWLAWIPFANLAMILQLGGFHWAWVFLALIPFAGWIALIVLMVIATWRVFAARNYPGWFSLSMIIPQIGGILYLIAIGFVAWADRGRQSKAPKKKAGRRR